MYKNCSHFFADSKKKKYKINLEKYMNMYLIVGTSMGSKSSMFLGSIGTQTLPDKHNIMLGKNIRFQNESMIAGVLIETLNKSIDKILKKKKTLSKPTVSNQMRTTQG